MLGSFIKIKTKTESMYVSVNDINCIEESNKETIIVTAYDRTFCDVVEINGVPCKSIDDVARELNTFDIV